MSKTTRGGTNPLFFHISTRNPLYMTDRRIIYPRIDQMIWDKRVFTLKDPVMKELSADFLRVGQLQPIVVSPHPTDPDGPFKLVIGRHRYGAAKENYKSDPSYIHSFLGTPCPPGTIAAIDVRDIPAEMLLNMEISENIYRMDLTWQEKAMALATLHEVEKKKFEEKAELGDPSVLGRSYTISDSAKKLAGATGGNASAIANKISQSLILAKSLDDKDISSADSAKAAFNNLKNKLTMEARKLSVDYEGDTPHILLEEDCIDLMIRAFTEESHPDLDPLFSLILADPPYGIGANTYDNMKEHKYDDSWSNATEIYRAISHLGYFASADRANMFLFCTPERWHDVRDIAESAGWVSWPRPVIWAKSNEGMRPWGQQGLAYTYETIYWGTKGKKGLIQSTNDIMAYYKPKSSEREHAAAKPVDLYARLIELTCLPGDWVFDPCVGSGTSFKAGYLKKVRVLGVENNAETAQIARKNLHWTGEAESGTVEPPVAYARSLADI